MTNEIENASISEVVTVNSSPAISDVEKVVFAEDQRSAERIEELEKIGQQLKFFENMVEVEFVDSDHTAISSVEVGMIEKEDQVTHEVHDTLTVKIETPLTTHVGPTTAHSGENNLIASLSDETLINEIESIPQKLAFKIGDVADMLGIKQYVLRFWETEFDLLKPKKASNNQRMYSRTDVINAYLVRKLLHRDRFSIEGAKQVLKSVRSQVKKELKSVEAKNIDLAKLDKIEHQVHELSIGLKNLRKLFK